MDFLWAVLMLLAAILTGIFWKEIMTWAFHKKRNKKK